MAGALGVVITTDVPVSGQHAQPVYVDDTLPIVGPSRAIVVTSGDVPQMGGPALAVRLAPAGAPALGPALPVYIVPGGGSLSGIDPNLVYTNKVKSLNPIAYWPMAESSGSVANDESGNGRNGAYTAVTLGAAGIGDGRTSASFDGTTSFNDVYGASLAGAFNGAEGTFAIWLKVSGAGVWGDGVRRYCVALQADANNAIYIYKDPNVIVGRRIGTATSKLVSFSTTSLLWMHLAITWSIAADQLKWYVDGVQRGTTQTGNAAYIGALAASTTCVGALSTTPLSVTSGTLAHAALWNTPLSAVQIATLAVVP